MYRKLLGRIFFQYAVVWKQKTKMPIFYTIALFSIINFTQLCSLILIIDILFKSNFFEIVTKFKWPVYLVSFFLFYFINYQLLRKIIFQSKLIQQYETDKIKNQRFLWGAIGYIFLSILIFFLLAKISYHIRNA
jgi:hypothetical protein